VSPKDKRSLSQARARAPVFRGGSPKEADALVRALDVGGTSEEAARRLTHGFHSYPAKMHPLTARRALGLLAVKDATVLDPFCGSGTVLVEALRRGARAVGVDASPLAVLVARAKVAVPAPPRLADRARRIAALVVQEGKAARRAGYEPPPPRAASQALRTWFAPHVLRELEALARAIEAEPDETLAPLFTAILSSILVKMSKRESDSAGRATERRLARGMAARLFAARAEELATGLQALARDAPSGTPAAKVELGDARRVPLGDHTVDAIVTSPPYAGTYDYLEQHALRLTFLGVAGARFEEREMGARRSFSDVRRGLATWEQDFGRALAEMRRVLRPGGRAILLVGDSLAGAGRAAQAVLADETTTRLAANAGLRRIAWASQTRPSLGATERAAFTRREKREHLILLEAT